MSDAAVPTAGQLFKTVERESTLTTRVTAEIERLIVGGRLQPGQRLPSERELADQFGVSRTVVREAVRGMVAKGLLEVRPGAYIFLGNGDSSELHTDTYDFNDDVIPVGTSYWVRLAERALPVS